MQTGGCPSEKPLTDLKANFLDIIDTITIDGFKNVPEFGVNNSKEIPQSKQETPAPKATGIQVETEQPLPSLSSVGVVSPALSLKRHRIEDSEETWLKNKKKHSPIFSKG